MKTLLIIEKVIIYLAIILLLPYVFGMPGSINIDDEVLLNQIMKRGAITYLIIASIGIFFIVLLIWRLNDPSKIKRRIGIGIALLVLIFSVSELLGVIHIYRDL
jgi:hypothetical protein